MLSASPILTTVIVSEPTAVIYIVYGGVPFVAVRPHGSQVVNWSVTLLDSLKVEGGSDVCDIQAVEPAVFKSSQV